MKKLVIVLVILASIISLAYLPSNSSYLSEPPMEVFEMNEEGYIDDIPFDTEEVANRVESDRSISFEEEGYIDDIPFDTEEVVKNM